MPLCKSQYRYFSICFISLFFLSCGNNDTEKDENKTAETVAMDIRVSGKISKSLKNILNNPGKDYDSLEMEFPEMVNEFYNRIGDKPVWSSSEKFSSLADSLYQFIAGAENEGLFPGDYHFDLLKLVIDTLGADSLTRKNAACWAKADLLLTDAFMHIVKDLKLGRLKPDSVSLNKDSVLADNFFITTLNELLIKKNFSALLTSLQPEHKSYWELKKGIKRFVDSIDRKEYTYITYPFKKKDVADSLYFIKLLHKRLLESNCIDTGIGLPDSAGLYKAIKKYQTQKGLKADGRYGKNLINALNSNDLEKFKRIAVTLDRYKQLPAKMPVKYIWVNIPGNYLVLMVEDTVVFESKVITGKPETRTPLLTSEISDIITYPTWTVPNSIIIKQYLPRLKNNPDYISKIGLKLVNSKGEVIDPNTVNWSKYSRGIPFKVMQASGDNNSLGVIKFNFNNQYAVYLHDTNQRYLFKNASRALSHGCVRVQEWEKLAYFIAKNDSIISSGKESLKYTADSIKSWISKKERHTVYVKNRIPLYIRYFSCEGKKGVIKFYDDIYGEDKWLIEKYFAKK